MEVIFFFCYIIKFYLNAVFSNWKIFLKQYDSSGIIMKWPIFSMI